MILYAAKLAELTYQGVSESSLNNLVLHLGRNNQDSLILKQMRSEITNLMHDLSWKYSSVCVHESQKNYPGLFHLSQGESSECGDSTKQASVSSDDSATSIWRPKRKILISILYWRKYHVQYRILLVRMVMI
jgi:hypothetical protein